MPKQRCPNWRSSSARLMLRSLVVVVVLVHRSGLADEASPAFVLVERHADGLSLEARASVDTPFEELRVVARAPVAPAALGEIIWSRVDLAHEARAMQRREVLEEGDHVRVERQVLDAPLLGLRDSLVHFRRQITGEGAVTIAFGLAPRPRASDAPPMRALRGQWTFTPDGAGGTWIEYRAVADPGWVPAFLAEGPNRQLTVAMVRGLIRRALESSR